MGNFGERQPLLVGHLTLPHDISVKAAQRKACIRSGHSAVCKRSLFLCDWYFYSWSTLAKKLFLPGRVKSPTPPLPNSP